MKIISCNVLAAALATALLSPAAIAQSEKSATTAQQVQEAPRAPLPPPVTAVNQDPRTPPMADTNLQGDEAPMTSTRPAPPSQAQSDSRASDQSAVALQNQWTTLDADGDGRISKTEAAANTAFNRDFSTIDSNGDGFISPDEHRTHVRRMAGNRPDSSPSQAQGAEHAASHAAVAQRELWSELDTDGDGRISSVESSMDPQFGARFRSIDADGDGYVSADEYRTYSQQERMSYSGDAYIDEEPAREEGTDAVDDPESRDEQRIDGEDGNQPVDDGRDGG